MKQSHVQNNKSKTKTKTQSVATKKKVQPRKAPQKRSQRRYKVLAIIVAFISLAVILYFVLFWLAQPPRPGKFYDTPDEIPSQPGQLVRSEPITSDVNHADAYRVLYSSRDINDVPITVSGMVFVPQRSAPEGGFPVVAWAHGTSGVARQCAPSLTPKNATQLVEGVQQLVDQGYMVTATDYQGLGSEGAHPYLIAKSEAQSVLDSVRAVQGKDDWHASKRYVLWGHSQGGHASLSSAQFAPRYASELDLLGVVGVAPATDLKVLLNDDIDQPFGRALGSLALVSWSKLFTGAELSRAVKSDQIPLVEAIGRGCIENKNQILVELPEIKLLSPNFLRHNLTTTEPWATIIQDNSVQPADITVPTFIAQGTADPVIAPSLTTTWVNDLCEHNRSVFYKEYADKDHMSVRQPANQDVVPWIGDRFAGKVAPSTCK